MDAARLLVVDLGPGVEAGFTLREPGGSGGPWSGLDLALHVGDDPAAVAANRRRLTNRLGVPVWFARQVHGTRVLGPADLLSGRGGVDPAVEDLADPEGADALVATAADQAVGVLVADCVPVLLADPVAGVVGAAHAGRRGLLEGVLEAVVTAMRQSGARTGDLRAAIGPGAGPCCYEVPEAMRAQADAVLPGVGAITRTGTPALDLPGGCRTALARLGVEQVETLNVCTIEDSRFYSYRRAATTGRFAGVIRRCP